jgi:hypothetical protein
VNIMAAPRFNGRVIDAIDAVRYFGIRAGVRPHRFVAIWAVVVDGRVFVRSWDARPDGWYHTLLEDRRGVLQVGDRTVRVRARRVRGDRLLDAIDAAYAAKYNTPGSLKYVRGFSRPPRRTRTIELVPGATTRLVTSPGTPRKTRSASPAAS